MNPSQMNATQLKACVQLVNRRGPTTAGRGFAASCCGSVIFTLKTMLTTVLFIGAGL